MTGYPSPPVYADLDLRDFPYMPLDVVRLRDSETAVIASGDEFRAAVMLWCAAWHQVPASSLPNDDRLLANLAGFGRDVDSWTKVKEGALRGFILCADGKLYHPVIAEKATEADNKRKAYAERAKAGANARWKDKQSSSDAQALLADAKGREGKGIEGKEDKKESRAVAKATRTPDSPEFEEFWKSYPKREGANPKAEARKAFVVMVKAGADPQAIISAVKRFAVAEKANIGTRFLPHASTWLRGQRFEDYQHPPSTAGPPQAPAGAPTDEELRKKYGQCDPVRTETEAASPNGAGVDHGDELRREGAEIRPGLRSF